MPPKTSIPLSKSSVSRTTRTSLPDRATKVPIHGRKKRHLKVDVEAYFDLEAAGSGDEEGHEEEEEERENSADRQFIAPDGEDEGDGDEYTGPRMDWATFGTVLPLVPRSRPSRVSRHAAKRLRRGDGFVPGSGRMKVEEGDPSNRLLEDDMP